MITIDINDIIRETKKISKQGERSKKSLIPELLILRHITERPLNRTTLVTLVQRDAAQLHRNCPEFDFMYWRGECSTVYDVLNSLCTLSAIGYKELENHSVQGTYFPTPKTENYTDSLWKYLIA